MSRFLNDCQLNGFRPKSFYSNTYRVRNKLISKMLTDRNLIRVVSAPNCYGKSTLCCQYAEIMFGFKNCFWIDCTDPCFLRDLDSGTMKDFLLAQKKVNLVVFDDLVYLHEDRTQSFIRCVNKLLSKGVEVIINLTPLSTPALPFDSECLFIDSKDLMVNNQNNKETSVYKKLSLCGDSTSCYYNKNSRFAHMLNTYAVPSVRYNKLTNFSILLKNNMPNNLPLGVEFCIFYAYAAQSGSLDVLQRLATKADFNLFVSYCSEYPHIFVDENLGIFSTPLIDICDINSLFNEKVQVYIGKYFDGKENLWKNIIDNCISVNNFCRAFEICRHNLKEKFCQPYLDEFYFDAIVNFQFANATLLNEEINNAQNEGNFITKVLYAWSLKFLGMSDRALEVAYLLLENTTDRDVGILCALLFYVGGISKDRTNAYKLLSCFSKSKKRKKCKISNIADIACNLVLCSRSTSTMDDYLKHFLKTELNEEFILCVALLLRIVKNNSKIAYCSALSEVISKCIKYCLEVWDKWPTLCQYLFCTSLAKCDTSYLNFWNIDIDKFKKLMQVQLSLNTLFNNEIAIYSNSEKDIINSDNCAVDENVQQFMDDDFSNIDISDCNVSDVVERISKVDKQAPLLRINLFSKFEVFVGDYKIPTSKFKRQMVRTLLACLVIRAGHDMSVDELTKILWPKSSYKSAYCNLNSVWTHARKLLSIDGKLCPYLTRIHKGFAIERANLVTDVDNIDIMLEKYTLDKVEPEIWVNLARQNFNIIKGELMPGESSNLFIAKYREIYKSKILDALLTASQRLCDAAFYRESLWFARLCYDIDQYREDIYSALMLAQYRSGNRSSAIDTYMACSKMIEMEEKGSISKKTRQIYDQIITETL